MKTNDYLKEQAALVSARLKELLNAEYETEVLKAMRYSAEGGGKRIRPVLSLEFSKACGGDTQAALDFGCAVEMIHTYSLIHDDLPCMDNDDVRRGKASCHIAFGEDTALLAGDALLTRAFSVISSVRGVKPENIIKAVMYLSEFAGINGMVGGQVLDLAFEKTSPTADEILKMYSLKTGALLKASAVLGCLSSDSCDDNMLASACEYGENLGIAFQIVDDILDIVGDEKKLGKPIGSDAKNDKSTYVSIYGIEKSKRFVEELTEKSVAALKKIDGETAVLENISRSLSERTY